MTTAIQWTDETWNPVVGCNQVSPGCDNCYAKTLHDMRHRAIQAGKQLARQYAQPFETVQLMDQRLTQPLSWRRPRRVFVNSVSDLFHGDVPDEFLDQVFAVMVRAHWHTFQILTKRAGRMRSYMADPARVERVNRVVAQMEGWKFRDGQEMMSWPRKNIWLGVSVENRATSSRIHALRETPAAVRFISFEPLLERVEPDLTGIDWAIVGGESGKNARPFDIAWAQKIVRACREYGAAPFVKQLGRRPCEGLVDEPVGIAAAHDAFIAATGQEYDPEPSWIDLRDPHGGDMAEWPEHLRVREFPNVASYREVAA